MPSKTITPPPDKERTNELGHLLGLFEVGAARRVPVDVGARQRALLLQRARRANIADAADPRDNVDAERLAQPLFGDRARRDLVCSRVTVANCEI